MQEQISKLNEGLTDFISYLASEKGVSPNTTEAYGRDLRSLINKLKTRSIESFKDATTEDLIGFLSDLKFAQYAPATIGRALIAIKVFFKFLKREGIIEENIALYLDSPKLWQTVPTILSIDEIECILIKIDLSNPIGLRDRAIIELLYSSGLRVSELCSLSIYSVDDNYVRVFGKGRKERLVPLGKKALDAVDNYLMHARCLFDSKEEQHLFLSRQGKPLDRIEVWKMVKRYASKAGISKVISPHTFRHSFATHLLDNGADLRIIQEMLGHANISSTDRYTHVSSTQLQKAFQRCHHRYESQPPLAFKASLIPK